jgi:hypothetical protein
LDGGLRQLFDDISRQFDSVRWGLPSQPPFSLAGKQDSLDACGCRGLMNLVDESAVALCELFDSRYRRCDIPAPGSLRR